MHIIRWSELCLCVNIAIWKAVTRILHSPCKRVSEYPKYNITPLSTVHCKNKFIPKKVVRNDVSSKKGTTFKIDYLVPGLAWMDAKTVRMIGYAIFFFCSF